MDNLYLVRKVLPFYVVNELTRKLDKKQFETLSNITLLLDTKIINSQLQHKLGGFYPIINGTRLFSYLETCLKFFEETDQQKDLANKIEALRKTFYDEKN